MTLGLCFWILMLIWLVDGAFTTVKSGAWLGGAKSLLLFILLLILGWATFGAPIHG